MPIVTLSNGEKIKVAPKPKMPFGPDRCCKCGAYAYQWYGYWAQPFCRTHERKDGI